MRNWIKRLLGREGKENSVRTQGELDAMEEKVRRYEMRIEHLRRERELYDKRHKRVVE